MSDLTAGDGPAKAAGGTDFSAAPMPSLRRGLEIIGWIAVAILVITGLTAIIGRADFMLGALAQPIPNPDEVFNPFDVRYYNNALATFLHLGPGFFVMVLGPLQFMRGVRKKHIKLHRISGRVFVLSGVIGAFSGAVIGVLDPFMGITGQGFNESMATVFLSIYVLFTLTMAIVRIRQRNFGQHREWMIRAFAIMLAIATERLMLTLFMSTTGIDVANLFGATFWMAGVINIAAGELWISLTRTPGNGARHWKDMDAKAVRA